MPSLNLLMTLLPALLGPATAQTIPLTLVLPSGQPKNAERISPDLAGLSIEMDRWPMWAGEAVGKPNAFVNQVLGNLQSRTGEAVPLRVGADSEDRAFLDLSIQVENATFPDPTATVPIPEAESIYIGRDWYALSGNLPAGTKFMWGINFKAHNLSETVAQAQLLGDTFQGSRADVVAHVKLENVEIGNEPDYYYLQDPAKRYNATTYTVQNYTNSWHSYAEAVSKVIRFATASSGDDGDPTLIGCSFATFGDQLQWNAAAAIAAGLLEGSSVAPYISRLAEHNYYGAFGYANYSVGDLMNKATVRTFTGNKYPSISATRANGLKFIIGEGNSYANHGVPGISNTIEAAIWGIDWLLLSASIGIERVHFHNGIGYPYSVIAPAAFHANDGLNKTDRPHILPLYHAFLVVNEAIGTSGNAQIAELNTYSTNSTAYGIWENNKLVRAVLLNQQVWTGAGPRPVQNVTLGGLGWDGGYATVKYLSGNMTTSMTGLTWAGQSFETDDGVPTGQVDEQPLQGNSVLLPATSAALICFK